MINSKYSDNKLSDIIMDNSQLSNLSKLSMDKKRQIIREVYNNENTSFRQLGRIFSVSKSIVENAIKTDK